MKDDEVKDNTTTANLEKRTRSELRFNEKNSLVVDKKTTSQLLKYAALFQSLNLNF